MTLAEKLKIKADEANLEYAKKEAQVVLEKIIADCEIAASHGEYEIILSERNGYSGKYDVDNNKRVFFIHTLKGLVAEQGLDIYKPEESEDSFYSSCTSNYRVRFK